MKPYVLMIEDDGDDRYLTNDTLSALSIDIPLYYITQTTDLLSMVNSMGMPALILLDDNAVPENGLSLLKRLKTEERFQQIPVVILSENNLPQHRQKCYAAGASSFIKKPNSIEGTRKKIETFFKYWFEVAEI